MKKLMIAALAVAGMSAFAADAKYQAVVEKFQVSVKTCSPSNGLESVKLKGLAFWDLSDQAAWTAGKPTLVLWDSKAKVTPKDPIVWQDPAKAAGKTTKIKTYYPGYVAPCELTDLFAAMKKGKVAKMGQGITLADNSGNKYLGYGSGKRTMQDKADKTALSGTIAGNIVSIDAKSYGTWKIAFDKSSTKLVLEKGYKMEDVLLKNKVEIVE